MADSDITRCGVCEGQEYCGVCGLRCFNTLCDKCADLEAEEAAQAQQVNSSDDEINNVPHEAQDKLILHLFAGVHGGVSRAATARGWHAKEIDIALDGTDLLDPAVQIKILRSTNLSLIHI